MTVTVLFWSNKSGRLQQFPQMVFPMGTWGCACALTTSPQCPQDLAALDRVALGI